MSIAGLNWALEQEVQPAARKFVLVVLANFADGEGSCFPGQTLLAALTGQAEKSVQRHLQQLEEAGLIERERRHRVNGTRTSDRYQLNWSDKPKPTNCRVVKTTTRQSVQDKATDCPRLGDKLSGEPKEEPKGNPQTRASDAPARPDGERDGRAPPIVDHWRERQPAVIEALGGEDGDGGKLWRAWLSQAVPVADDGEAFTLAAPSVAIADYIARELAATVAEALGRDRVEVATLGWVGLHLDRERRKAARQPEALPTSARPP